MSNHIPFSRKKTLDGIVDEILSSPENSRIRRAILYFGTAFERDLPPPTNFGPLWSAISLYGLTEHKEETNGLGWHENAWKIFPRLSFKAPPDLNPKEEREMSVMEGVASGKVAYLRPPSHVPVFAGDDEGGEEDFPPSG